MKQRKHKILKKFFQENNMYLMLIDESKDTIDKYYIFGLCGIIVDSDKIIDLENEIERLKREYGVRNLKEFRTQKKRDIRIKSTEELAHILKRYDTKIISAFEISDKDLVERFKDVLKRFQRKKALNYHNIEE